MDEKKKKNCNRKSERRNKNRYGETERSRNRITKIKQIKVKKELEMQ